MLTLFARVPLSTARNGAENQRGRKVEGNQLSQFAKDGVQQAWQEAGKSGKPVL